MARNNTLVAVRSICLALIFLAAMAMFLIVYFSETADSRQFLSQHGVSKPVPIREGIGQVEESKPIERTAMFYTIFKTSEYGMRAIITPRKYMPGEWIVMCHISIRIAAAGTWHFTYVPCENEHK